MGASCTGKRVFRGSATLIATQQHSVLPLHTRAQFFLQNFLFHVNQQSMTQIVTKTVFLSIAYHIQKKSSQTTKRSGYSLRPTNRNQIQPKQDRIKSKIIPIPTIKPTIPIKNVVKPFVPPTDFSVSNFSSYVIPCELH